MVPLLAKKKFGDLSSMTIDWSLLLGNDFDDEMGDSTLCEMNLGAGGTLGAMEFISRKPCV